MRFDQGNQTLPGHHLIHLDQEALAAGLLTFAGVLGIGERHLFHLGSTAWFVLGAYFTRAGSLFQSFENHTAGIPSAVPNIKAITLPDFMNFQVE